MDLESIKILNESNIIKNRNKFKQREPTLYYYYQIDSKTYKYTCTKKNDINSLPFNCSDTSCKAKGIYNKLTGEFSPKKLHI